MLVVRGSVEMVDFVLVVEGPEVVAVAGKAEEDNIVVVAGDELNDFVDVVAEVIAGDMGGAFLIAEKRKKGRKKCITQHADKIISTDLYSKNK